MGGASPRCDFSEAQFEAWISQEHRKDLALLLGAQDGQERWRWPSVHKVKSTLRFVITLAIVQVPGGLAGATSLRFGDMDRFLGCEAIVDRPCAPCRGRTLGRLARALGEHPAATTLRPSGG